MVDAGIAMFRPAVSYKPMEWLLVNQHILLLNESSGLWECSFSLPNMLRCPPGWTLENPANINKVVIVFLCSHKNTRDTYTNMHSAYMCSVQV